METEAKYLFDGVYKCIKEESEKITNFILNNYNNVYSLFEQVNAFKVENGKITSEIESLLDKMGIYIFKSDVGLNILDDNKIVDKLKLKKFNSIYHSAQIYKNKINLIINEHKVFYLGKSFNLKVRINEHCSNSEVADTYSLKMQTTNRANYFNCNFYIFILKEEFIDYASLILSSIESNLHESLNPIIGSSRV
jgi:hypothetical protein